MNTTPDPRTANDPERQGRVSMSSLPRLDHCRGSLALIRELTAAGTINPDADNEQPDEVRDAGHRMHEALYSLALGLPTAPELSADEHDIVADLWHRTQEAVVEFFGLDPEDPDTSNLEFVAEQRLWLFDPTGTRKIASGAIDLFVLQEDRATRPAILHIDYKTGHLDVENPDDNAQFRGYRALLWDTYDARAIKSVCLHARRRSTATGICDHDGLAADMAATRALIAEVADPAADWMALGLRPDQDACRYCPARIACPALRRAAALPSRDTLLPEPRKAVAVLMERLPTADAADLVRLWEALEATKPLGKALDQELDIRLAADPDSVPGFTLAPKRANRKIVDPPALLRALLDAGATQDEILAAVSVTLTDAERIHRAATGLKGKTAEAAFASLAADMIEKPEPQLKPTRTR